MSFFDKFGKKVEEATQVATKKSTELVEITKLNASIKAEEQKIQELYREIGEKVYEDFCIDNETYGDLDKICVQIKDSHSKIDQLKAKVREIKNVKLCSNCNAQVSSSSAFCDQCGTRLED